MDSKNWYVLHSKPRKESLVTAYLASQGIETFYPTIRVKPVNPRAAKVQAYFPAYLFVNVDLAAVGVSILQWIPGAVGLVQFDSIPAPVPDSLIQQLKQHVAQVKPAENTFVDSLRSGDPIIITSGPFAGQAALFDHRLNGTQRVQVLLDMLRHRVRAVVNSSAIAKRPS